MNEIGNDATRRAIAVRDRFIAVVGHELHNHVAPLVMLTDQLDVFAARNVVRARLTALCRSIETVAGAIDRVAELAQLRDIATNVARARCDLAEVVAHVCAGLEPHAHAGGVALHVTSTGPIVGLWDRARVQQMVAHLVSNAVQHGGEGAVEVVVRGHEAEAEVAVRDHGPGIASCELLGLFDRLDHVRRSGLFVVKTVSTAMGGTVAVELPVDGGAQLRIVLPWLRDA